MPSRLRDAETIRFAWQLIAPHPKTEVTTGEIAERPSLEEGIEAAVHPDMYRGADQCFVTGMLLDPVEQPVGEGQVPLVRQEVTPRSRVTRNVCHRISRMGKATSTFRHGSNRGRCWAAEE